MESDVLRNRLTRQLLLMIIGLLMAGGCGKKGPPMTPVPIMPEPVTDLEQRVAEHRIELRWTVPAPKNDTAVEGFLLYRSKVSLVDGCPGCPEQFEKIADIQVRSDSGNRRRQIAYAEIIEEGFRYAYKVVGYTWDGMKSKDSNTVVFDPRVDNLLE
jgi:hypothetical protein